MITQEQQIQGAELVKTLAQKAWENSSFKEQLINNPVSTIESVTGQVMIADVKVVVEDQTDESVIYLNIPRKADINSMELTDEQLEMVSGGESVLIAIAICCFLGGAFVGGYAIGKDMATTANTNAANAAK